MAYTNAIFYLDLVNGSDTARTALTSCTASNPSGSITRINKTAHGLVTGAVVTTSAFSTWLNGDFKITKVDNDNFDLDNTTWQATADTSGTVTPFGGSSWADAWKTITNGPTIARIAPGDTIRISKTPDPVSIGNATWTDVQTGGGFPATKNIASSTNASPVVVTINSHGYSNGDVIQIIGHTSNAGANGAWTIANVATNTFELVGSTGTGTGGANGTAQKINSKAVVLATAQTQTIDRTNVAWTTAAGGDTTVALVAAATEGKEGGGAMRFTLDASAQANILQAYKATGTLDLSSYQKISFWLKNSAAITEPSVNAGSFLTGVAYTILTVGTTNFTLIGAASNTVGVTFVATGAGSGTGTASSAQWMVALCSDTAGATPVDKFIIPAIPSTGQYVPLSIIKAGGGNLGNSIQSISIRTGAAPTNSSNILISNIFASTTSGLCLQCLISKNGSAQGGTEAYYGIQSISQDGKVILLDNHVNNYANVGRGYTGTSETVTTYMRSTFKTAMAATNTAQVSVLNDSGTLGNLISYEFGYNTSSGLQDGETYLDGLNGFGYGIYCSSKSFNSLNLVSVFRYNHGFYFTNSANNVINNVPNANNNTGNGLNLSALINSSITNVINANNNNSYGVYLYASSLNNEISTITNVNGNIFGFSFASASLNKIGTILKASNNSNSGVSFDGGCKDNLILNLTTLNNSSAGITYQNTNLIRNASISETTEFIGLQWSQGVLWSYDHDQTDGNHWGFFYGGTFNWQTTTYHGTETGSWKTAITSADRKSNYKAILPLDKDGFGGAANTNLVVTAWVKKDHATDIACRLVCYADDALGITEVSATKANDTDWEQLSITLNSAHANPVFRVVLETWYVSGNSNSYLGAITVT